LSPPLRCPKTPPEMKIVVVGKGGREHALVRALAESPSAPELFCFPGSDAIFQIARPVAAAGLESLVEWMEVHEIDLCVAGEESYLVKGEGLANLCEKAGIPCWGPHFQSAQLEASKEFAKLFLERHGIPTGKATATSTLEEARAAIGGKYPTVLKFDGLAAGKGVAVCMSEGEGEAFLDEVFVQKRFGPGRVLVEEFLTGPEVSIFAAIVDDHYLVFTPARDYKRIGEGDAGANTGGMGAVASRQLIPAGLLADIESGIVAPTVAGLRKDKLPYRGFLYFGLMLTPQGPKVIEYNCRFGDPECQAVMPLVKGDLAEFCLAGAKGKLKPDLISFDEGWSVCVVLASAGYPESSRNGDVIHGIDHPAENRVYHAGTHRNPAGEWETHGGRVLAAVAGGSTRAEAVAAAHAAADKITFDGAQRRRDIGILHFQD
jgi:phosphoribosylamine--glycine ligase